MRLDFNVLWVEDQPGRVDAQIQAIARRMEAEGFEFRSTLCQSLRDVQARIADNVFADEVDLILVDWDLGEGERGQNVIGEIRERIQYKDVIFYSANTDSSELRRLVYENDLEGVYCVTRLELVDEVEGVFDSLVKKVLDLDHVRGIVMGATSDIDQMVAECLNIIHEKRDDDGRAAMLREALERIEKGMESTIQKRTALTKITTFPEMLNAHSVFTANDCLRMLSRALTDETFQAQGEYRPFITAYIDKIVPGRNILGHVVLVPDGRPQGVTDNTGKVISLEETRDLRRLLLNLRREFRSLLLSLREQS